MKSIIAKHVLSSNLINITKSKVISEVLDLAGINYTILDPDGNYIVKNNSILRVLNKPSADLLNARAIDVKSWEDCQRAMASGCRIVSEDWYDGRCFLSIKQPLISESSCQGILVLSLDITDKKKAQKVKHEFLRNMGHDIRTPLVGIYSLASLLEDDETDSIKRSYLSNIVTSSERLTELLNQVLEITDLGSCPVKYTDHDVNEVVDSATQLMIAAAREKGLELTVNCPHAIINSDKFRLSRILLNLLSNAVKFTPSGMVHIDAEVKSKLRLTVEDTGVGIPQDKFDVIFEKFTKLKPSGESQEFTGAGVGLYVAKQMAREIGGDILVESEVGKGSKFSFVQL